MRARVTDVAKCRRQEPGLPRGLSSLSDLNYARSGVALAPTFSSAPQPGTP